MNRKLSVAVSGALLAGLGWTQGILAQCVQDDSNQARYMMQVDGTTACTNLQQVGCRIDSVTGDGGDCTAVNSAGDVLFTAHAVEAADGSINWSLLSSNVQVDSVLVGGGQKGNACNYFYPDVAPVGQTGMGYQSDKGSFAKVTYVEVCTDQSDDVAPPPPPPVVVPNCPTDVQNALDDLSIPGDIAFIYQFDDFLGATMSFCVKGGSLTELSDDIQYIPCTNEPTTLYDPENPSQDPPLCSSIPTDDPAKDRDGDGYRDFFFRNNLSPFVAGLKGSSCIYTCLPPPMTLDGRNQCGYICR